MARVKIGITIPENLLAQAKQAVTRGEARSVSAYIGDAIAAHSRRRELRAYVDASISEYGEPSADADGWAGKQVRRLHQGA